MNSPLTNVSLKRITNQLIARLTSRFPFVARKFIDAYTPREQVGIPWHPMKKALREARIALVTTAGVHHMDQPPFNMTDPDGDPSYRAIDHALPVQELTITHDYYNHADADKDINIVFPIERLAELQDNGIIGGVAGSHYGFMGHIDGTHIPELVNHYAPEVAKKLRADQVDAVLLSPG